MNYQYLNKFHEVYIEKSRILIVFSVIYLNHFLYLLIHFCFHEFFFRPLLLLIQMLWKPFSSFLFLSWCSFSCDWTFHIYIQMKFRRFYIQRFLRLLIWWISGLTFYNLFSLLQHTRRISIFSRSTWRSFGSNYQTTFLILLWW